MASDAKQLAQRSLAHLEQVERDLGHTYPGCWEQLDQLRASSGMSWPRWCLLPMAAAAAVVANHAYQPPQPHSIAQLSATYAWRFSRSTYVLEPTLAHVLLNRVPDTISVEDFTGLPEWCVYVAGDEHTGVGGFWAHLEHDTSTGRPELRILLHTTPGRYLPIPVYLDRDSTTEALADFRATGASSLATPGINIRGAQPDAAAAGLADYIDGYLNILLYLASQDADITHADRPGTTPVKPRRPKPRGNNDIWLVGYQH